MEIKDMILELRRNNHLSREELAERLLVTRQAVSRWENGETTPNIDTLQLLAKSFNITVDHLLGHPAGICQSCGMSLEQEDNKGTGPDGSKSEEYCSYCYQQGKFVQDLTMEEMIEHNIQDLDQWNKSAGMELTEQEARVGLLEFLPSLKRWRDESGV